MQLRSILCRSVIAGLCCLYLPSCNDLPQKKTHSSFATLTNALPAYTHNFASVPFEQTAQEIADLIQQGEFSKVEDILNTHIEQKTSTRGGFYYPILVIDNAIDEILPSMDDKTLMDLGRWVQSSPESALPYVFRAKYFYEAAWRVRGEKYINETPEENRNGYRELMEYYLDDLNSAFELNPKSPIVLEELLDAGRDVGSPREEFDSLFDQLMEFDPYFAHAYVAKSNYLLPQWRGSKKELLEFIDDSMAKAPRGTALPLLIPFTHDDLGNYGGNKRTRYLKQPEVWADIEFAYTRLIEDFPKGGLYPAWYAETAADIGKYDIAREYIQVALEREPNHPKVLKIKSYIDGL